MFLWHDEDASPVLPNEKTGTIWTASLHIICAVIGAGVLGLPRSVAWLGWIAGPLLIFCFYAISLMSSWLLASCYRINGIEYGHYHHLVRSLLGRTPAIVCSVIQLINMVLVCIAYTITAGMSMVEIAQEICILNGEDVESSKCFSDDTGGEWKMTLIFGAAIIPLTCLVPSLEEAWWTSAVGTIGSFTYSGIVLVISLANSGNRLGSIDGITDVNTSDKVFGVFNAIGAISAAFNYMLVLLEIQDTFKQPPSAVTQMKKASTLSSTTTFICYIALAVSGYAAYGNNVASNVLQSVRKPSWAILVANIAVILHMLSAVLVFALPVLDACESWIKILMIRRAENKMKKQDSKGKKEMEEMTEKRNKTEPSAALDDSDHDKVANSVKMYSPFETKVHETQDDIANLPDNEDQVPRETEKTNNNNTHYHPSSELTKFPGFDHTSFPVLQERIGGSELERIVSSGITSIKKRGDHIKGNGIKSSNDIHLHSLSTMTQGMSSRMYLTSLGFAAEEVPLNTEGFLIPWYIRIPIRITYCMAVLGIAIGVPGFLSIIGLIGALTFFPLSIHFPISCYLSAFPKRKASRPINFGLKSTWFVMLVVAAIGLVGSIQTMF